MIKYKELFVNKYNIVSCVLLLLILSNVFSAIWGINLSLISYLLVIITLLIQLLYKHNNRFFIIILGGCFLILPCIISYYWRIAFSNIFYALSYYVSWLVFFLFGYYLLKKDSIYVLLKVILVMGILFTLFWSLSDDLYIKLASNRLLAHGDIALEGFQTSVVSGIGYFRRNGGFVFSALDFSYIMFFLTYFFIHKSIGNESRINYKYILVAFVSFCILLTTVTRGSIIGVLVSMTVGLVFLIRSRYKKVLFLGVVTIIMGIFVIFNFRFLERYFYYEGSASIHRQNLFNALSHIKTYPLGTGLGSSGWRGDKNAYIYIYSEGSFFTSIIENGLVFILFYVIVGCLTYHYNRSFLFAIYCGYICISYVLPIGFSYIFNFLFWSYLGVVCRENVLFNRNTLR